MSDGASGDPATDETLERVLSWILDLPPAGWLSLADGGDEEILGLTDQQLDEALREAKDRGLLNGERAGFARNVRWTHLVVSADGLRFAGQWPPVGREHHAGPWDDGHWGTYARPVLERIRDDKYRHQMLTGLHNASSNEEWHEHLAAFELLDAGYISGDPKENHAISNMRLVKPGREALNPTPRNALDEARQMLRSSRADAVIHAVEIALGERLLLLAHANEPSTDEPITARLARLNEQLAAKGGAAVYGKPWKELIQAVLAVRNEYAHGRASTVPRAVDTWVMDSVSILLTVLPDPEA